MFNNTDDGKGKKSEIGVKKGPENKINISSAFPPLPLSSHSFFHLFRNGKMTTEGSEDVKERR